MSYLVENKQDKGVIMIGKAKSQLSLLDSVFNYRKKRSRSDDLLKKINEFVD